jgi:hypothetical protein
VAESKVLLNVAEPFLGNALLRQSLVHEARRRYLNSGSDESRSKMFNVRASVMAPLGQLLHRAAVPCSREMSNQFKGQRAILTRTISIDSTPGAIFPLLCPVREGEWADGWVGKPVFSVSGYAEENGLFATEHAGEEDTLWFVTKRDTTTYEIEFVYFAPHVQVVRLTIRVTPQSADKSNISVKYIRTGISEAGNEFIKNSGAHFDKMMTEWKTSLNHYMKTGELLKQSH